VAIRAMEEMEALTRLLQMKGAVVVAAAGAHGAEMGI
jgi:hypothetical protein